MALWAKDWRWGQEGDFCSIRAVHNIGANIISYLSMSQQFVFTLLPYDTAACANAQEYIAIRDILFLLTRDFWRICLSLYLSLSPSIPWTYNGEN